MLSIPRPCKALTHLLQRMVLILVILTSAVNSKVVTKPIGVRLDEALLQCRSQSALVYGLT